MYRIRTACAVVAAFALMATVAGASPARESIVLGFGDEYVSSDGGRSTHRGVDVSLPAGAEVTSPVGGTVSFVGRVPSASGGTILSASIRAGDAVVSLSPLDSAVIEEGATLAAGDRVGFLADGGDPSSAQTHLHIGVRRGGMYVDPATFLTFAAPSAAPQVTPVAPRVAADPLPSPGPAPAAAVPFAPVVAPASEPVPVAVAIPAESAAPLPATQALAPATGAEHVVDCSGEVLAPTFATPRVANVLAESPAGVARSFAGGLAQGSVLARLGGLLAVTREPAPAATGDTPAPSTSAHAREVTASTRVPAQQGVATATPRMRVWALPTSPAGIAASITSLFAVALLFTRRAIERRFQSNPPVSGRFGSMLQHLQAGDTLCGLTSCSGLLPSQSRGRLAQRR